jgi:hypothetical protein
MVKVAFVNLDERALDLDNCPHKSAPEYYDPPMPDMMPMSFKSITEKTSRQPMPEKECNAV